MRLTPIEIAPVQVRITSEEILADLLYPAPAEAAGAGAGVVKRAAR